jgi:hypothetical protein
MVHADSQEGIEVRYIGRSTKPLDLQDPVEYVSYQTLLASGSWSTTIRMPADEFDQKVGVGEISIIDNEIAYHHDCVLDVLSAFGVHISERTKDELANQDQNAREITYG